MRTYIRRDTFSTCALVLLAAVLPSCGGRPAEAPRDTPAPQDRSAPGTGYLQTSARDGGRISGVISLSGPVPELPARPVNKDAAVCGAARRRSEELLVADSGGLKHVVVIVEGVRQGKPLTATPAVIDQVKCEYVPHLQVMAANTDLTIVNTDPILHNIHVYRGETDLFNVAQPLRGQTNVRRIDGPGFIYAECDVHGWMRGYIAVVDHPYFAVTDEQGRFEIDQVPPGTYTVRLWHEYLGESQRRVMVPANGRAALDVDLQELLAKRHLLTTRAAAPQLPAKPEKATVVAKTDVLSGDVTVNMVSDGGTFTFEPADLTIKAGTTVKWMNTSGNRHTATGDPKFEKSAGQAALPPGATPWSTPFIANGQEASQAFTVPGKYRYFCRNHGQFGMVATITVVP